mmetsp:Transcript_3060/g.6274  ORF Transcript_3060/g.6274 Transcript_3060/m.6274 type:complete len:227 (+) Transcript_3060:443-1123(+)
MDRPQNVCTMWPLTCTDNWRRKLGAPATANSPYYLCLQDTMESNWPKRKRAYRAYCLPGWMVRLDALGPWEMDKTRLRSHPKSLSMPCWSNKSSAFKWSRGLVWVWNRIKDHNEGHERSRLFNIKHQTILTNRYCCQLIASLFRQGHGHVQRKIGFEGREFNCQWKVSSPLVSSGKNPRTWKLSMEQPSFVVKMIVSERIWKFTLDQTILFIFVALEGAITFPWRT